jgi:hypothetical protein
VEQFIYLGTTLKYQHCIEEEIRSLSRGMLAIFWCRIFCPPVCYPKIWIQVYRNIILTVLYGCETWLLTLREERRLRVFENRVLRRIFGLKRDEVTGEWRMRSLMICTSHPIFIVCVIKSRRVKFARHVARRGERRDLYRVLVGNLRERDHLGSPSVDGRTVLRNVFRKWEWTE